MLAEGSQRPSSACAKARSVSSSEQYSPRSTAQDRRTPPRSRQSRTLPRPQDAILRVWKSKHGGAEGLKAQTLSQYHIASSPRFIKKGNPEGLNVKVSMHLCKNCHLTAKAHLVCAPGHHHLQQMQNELQVQTSSPARALPSPAL